MPSYAGGQDGNDWVNPYDIPSYQYKLVADYLNAPLLSVYNLGAYEFLYYQRDAFIHRLSQTEQGQAYLSNAYRLEQTKPDRKAISKKIGGGDNGQ